MEALRDAIAQIDALLVRLQTDPPANGTHTPATPAASLPPVLAALSTGEQPLDASGRAATASPSPAATALAASAAAAATTATAAARSARDTSSGPGTEPPAQTSAGGATATEYVPAAPADSTAAAGKAKAATKAAKVPKAPPPEPTPADLFSKAHIQVARVLEASELESSDKLYKTRIQVRNGEVLEERQIMAGLRKHVSRSELEGSHVIVILNLKTARLAGEASEGMILAGVHADDAIEHGELVKPVRPPEGSEAGDRVTVDGEPASADFPKVLKSDAWKKLAALLRVRGGAATVDGRPLVTRAGPLTVPGGLPDGATIS